MSPPPPPVKRFLLDSSAGFFATSSDTVVVWGGDVLMRYNLHSRAMLKCVKLNFRPQGMTIVSLGDKLCVALSNR